MKNVYYRPLNIFHCLTSETKVLTCKHGNHYIPISELKFGDKVFSHTGELRRIERVIVHEVNAPILEITLENNEVIRITDEHPILTKRGWIKSGELCIDDILLHIAPKSCTLGGRIEGNLARNKTFEERYGVEKAASIKGKISNSRKGKSNDKKGLTNIKYFGLERGLEINSKISIGRKGKGIGKREHYTLTEKHNSQQRKGKKWADVYGHSRPNYGGNIGEKNPNWKNGISRLPYPYPWGCNEFKEQIKEKDNHTCQLCGTNQNLHIHHIDYNKTNIFFSNLITLCKVCNSKVNFKRDYWKAYFSTKVLLREKILQNGTKISYIKWVWYKGLVYNLEVEIDHTYIGKGIIYHNSDVSIGRILPKWTNPETGEAVVTEVDDVGWKIVGEIRDDVEIANKTWEEVLKGNIRSFSVAGSSKEKLQKQENGMRYEQIKSLDFYEVTLCEIPVCPEAKFEVLWHPEKVAVF